LTADDIQIIDAAIFEEAAIDLSSVIKSLSASD